MVTVKEVENDAELQECQRIRIQVFVHGQGVPQELELEYEDECVHFLALNDDQQPVGTGRLRDAEGVVVKFERLAVLEAHQGKGHGRAILQHLQRYSAQHKPQLLPKMHAQVHAMPFYESQGWRRCGDEFDEAGIMHVAMIRPPEDPGKLLAASDDRTPAYIRACLQQRGA